MRNRYKVMGDTTIIYVKYKSSIIETLVDTEDLPRLLAVDCRWYAFTTKGFTYVRTNVTKSSGLDCKTRTIRLHRFIMDTAEGLLVDHKNHDTLDNRKGNLRNVTKGVNNLNRKGARKDNPTGHRGVRKVGKNKFEARVVYKGKQQSKWFDSLEEAIEGAKEMRAKIFPKTYKN